MKMVVVEISRTVEALKRCNAEWRVKHQARLDWLMGLLPHGSGIDSGVELLEISTPQKLVFKIPFHQMNSHGFYVGWKTYRCTVTPVFDGIAVKVTGGDGAAREYLHDVMYHAFCEACPDAS